MCANRRLRERRPVAVGFAIPAAMSPSRSQRPLGAPREPWDREAPRGLARMSCEQIRRRLASRGPRSNPTRQLFADCICHYRFSRRLRPLPETALFVARQLLAETGLVDLARRRAWELFRFSERDARRDLVAREARATERHECIDIRGDARAHLDYRR